MPTRRGPPARTDARGIGTFPAPRPGLAGASAAPASHGAAGRRLPAVFWFSLGVVLLGLAADLLPWIPADLTARYNDDFAFVLLCGALGLASLGRARAAGGVEERRMWRWFALAMACWAVADLGETLDQSLKQLDISGLPSTVLYVAAYSAWLLATVEAPHRRSGWTLEQPGWRLEQWGALLFCLALAADLIIVPQLVAPASVLPSTASSVLFVAFDLVFIGRILGLRQRVTPTPWRRWYGLVALVAGLMLLCDVLAVLITDAVLPPWDGLAYDALWYLPMLLMAVACGWPTPQPLAADDSEPDPDRQQHSEGTRPLESGLVLLTPAFVLIHLVLGLTPSVPPDAERARTLLAIGATLLLAGLAVQRQRGLERRVQRLNRELHEATEQLAENRRLDAVARLAGGVAHNFNNLLTVIMGHGELLQHRVAPGSEGAEDLGRIQRAAERAARIAADLLAFSAPGPRVQRPVQLNELLGGLLPPLRALTGEGVRVTFHPAAELPTFPGDPTQLEEAILHLAEFCRERMGGRGELWLATDWHQVAAATGSLPGVIPAGRYVRLAVEDSGSPLEATEQQRLFEPFDAPEATRLRLGLAAVRGIVQGHGGSILVRSEPGRGLRFELLFSTVIAKRRVVAG